MTALPSGLLLFDTGIYIRFLRGESYQWLGASAPVFQRTIFTVVVASELYAGTRSRKEKQMLDELCHAHAVLEHFSTPSAAIWVETGTLLRRASNTFGQMDWVQHFRDLLIASEAARAGATLVTENARDFVRWKSVLASAHRTLNVVQPS